MLYKVRRFFCWHRLLDYNDVKASVHFEPCLWVSVLNIVSFSLMISVNLYVRHILVSVLFNSTLCLY